MSRPFSPSLPTAGAPVHGTAIARLFQFCRPDTITRRVRTVIVDAFNTGTRGSRAHVFDESREAFFPLVANRDTARTVILVILASWIEAALLHSRPHVPEPGVSKAVLRLQVANCFPPEAPTANRVTGSNVIDSTEASSPAITFEFPQDASALTLACGPNSDQSSVSVTCDIERKTACGHNSIMCQLLSGVKA